MSSAEFTEIACPNCSGKVRIPVPGDAVCQSDACGQMFRAFSRRDREGAEQFLADQPSLGGKSLIEAEDGRFVVAYYYEDVQPFIIDKLTDVIDEEALEIIQAGLAEKLRKPMTIIERREGRYHRINPLNPRAHYTRYCTFVRDALEGEGRCCEYDEEQAREHYDEEHPRTLLRRCWAGLYDFAIPVVINEQVVAFFFTGQLRLRGKRGDADLLDGVQRVKEELRLDEAATGQLLEAAEYGVEGAWIEECELDSGRRQWEAVVDSITRLGSEKFYAQRQVRERLFLDEILALFETVRDEDGLWRVLDRVLIRLCEFCHFEFATFFASEGPGKPFTLKAPGRLPGSETMVGRELNLSEGDVDFRSRKLVLLDASRPAGGLMKKVERLLEPAPVGFALVAPITFREKGRGLMLLVNRTSIAGREPKRLISDFGRQFLEKAVHEIEMQIRNTLASVDLRQRDRDREEYEAATMHVLRAHMQSLLGKSGYLRALLQVRGEQKVPTDQIIGLCNKIDEEVKRLSTRTKSLSYTTVTEAVRLRRDEPISLEALVRDCAERYKYAGMARGISILFEKDSYDLPDAFTDPGELDVVFSNIIDNAVKYSHNDRKVLIDFSFDKVENTLTVSVSDFGLGIIERDPEKIFTRYYRSKFEDPRRFIPGAGIGLAVAKEIVEMHGGKIWYTSIQAEGPAQKSGVERYKTTFYVTIPRRPLLRKL